MEGKMSPMKNFNEEHKLALQKKTFQGGPYKNATFNRREYKMSQFPSSRKRKMCVLLSKRPGPVHFCAQFRGGANQTIEPNSNSYLGLVIKLEFVKLRYNDTWHGLLV